MCSGKVNSACSHFEPVALDKVDYVINGHLVLNGVFPSPVFGTWDVRVLGTPIFMTTLSHDSRYCV
jgi:hypothetical protein